MDEIASSMQHLDAMQASVEELRGRMAQAHGDHQEAGESLIKLLEMLQEATRVQAAIKESRKVTPWLDSNPSAEPLNLSVGKQGDISGVTGGGGALSSAPGRKERSGKSHCIPDLLSQNQGPCFLPRRLRLWVGQ